VLVSWRMRKKLILALGGLVLLVLVGVVVAIGPRNIIGMARYDIRSKGTLAVGDRAPDVELVTPEGARVRLVDHLGPKPTVLIFGSFT
jgi:hypothetical protein